jgi:hypothetical protein
MNTYVHIYIYIYIYFIYIMPRSFILRLRNISDETCRENQNTRYVFSNFSFENHAVYKKMWEIL